MTNVDATLASLRASGRRVTAQRRVVLDVIEGAGEHLDAEAVYERARQRDPKISLATVYRTLAVLRDMGLIEQRFLARNHEREHYEPFGASEHYHFVCRSCRRAIEFQSARVQQMRAELSNELGFEVSRTCVCVEGLCPDCAARRRAQEE